MKLIISALLFSTALFAQSPSEGYARLMEGNDRYVKGKLLHPDRNKERRTQTAIGQKT